MNPLSSQLWVKYCRYYFFRGIALTLNNLQRNQVKQNPILFTPLADVSLMTYSVNQNLKNILETSINCIFLICSELVADILEHVTTCFLLVIVFIVLIPWFYCVLYLFCSLRLSVSWWCFTGVWVTASLQDSSKYSDFNNELIWMASILSLFSSSPSPALKHSKTV